MATSDDAQKPTISLAHEGLVKFCVNMGNNMFMEQWVTPFVHHQLLEEVVYIKVHNASDPW